MKGPREVRRIVNAYRTRRARQGVRNGNPRIFDDIGMERLLYRSKRRYSRNRQPKPAREPD